MAVKTRRPFPYLFTTPWWFLPFLFLTIFGAYSFTLNPSLFRNDSPETITACFTLGVSHPPGYPLHTLLGRLFALEQIGNPAMTMNYFSAFLGALGVCLFSLNLWALLKKKFPEPKKDRGTNNFSLAVVSLVGGLCFAFSKSYWSVSLAAKGGIYNFQVVLELGFLLYFQFWLQNLKKTAGDSVIKQSYFLIFLFNLGLVNHWPTHLLLTLAVVITVLVCSQSGSVRFFQNLGRKHIFTALTMSLLVLSLYLYLPLRAHLNPGLNFGNPSTFHGFISSLTREKYFKTETISSFLPTALSTIQDKGIYISDRFRKEFNLLFSFLSFPGLFLLWRQKLKTELLFLLSLFFSTLLANLLYLQVLPIEYWHMDDHLMTLNWVTALLGSAGLYFLFNNFKPKGFAKYFLCGLLALLPIFSFFKNLAVDDQKNEFLFWGYGMEALKSMDKDATYFAETDYDYFSILYLQQEEQKRSDVVLSMTAFLTEGDWKQLVSNVASGSSPTGHLLYCAFPNGDFINGYLKHSQEASLRPMGTIIQFMPPKDRFKMSSIQKPLAELWQRYLDPKCRSYNPINGLLLELCAHPYLNMANYLNFRSDLTSWKKYYSYGVSLIQEPKFQAETWEALGDADLKSKVETRAIVEYLLAVDEYHLAGMTSKEIECREKENSMNPYNFSTSCWQ